MVTMSLTPWSQDDMRSGYIATQTLRKICKLSRDVVRCSTSEQALIQYDNGKKSVDAGTDLLCFVVQRFWSRQKSSNFYDLKSIWPEVDRADIRKRLGGIRRTGGL
jgi:hypothetical protein